MRMFEDRSINDKLDRILQLLALVAVREMPQTAQIATLSRAGFSPKEIANVLGTSSNTVRVTLVSIRKMEAHGAKSVVKPKRDKGETKDE